ncbi:putative reverse transcriptase domain-containing protein [Tanacetum coccineum]
MTITRSSMTPEAIEELINRRVEEAITAHEEACDANALETKNQSQNGSDGGNGNGGNGNGRNENPDENGRGDRPVARECTYQDFMKCQSLNFKGTEGVVGLIRWFKKMETVFHISNCPEKSQVKNEIQKMETELWNLTVKNNDLTAYTQRFQELTMLCTKMVPEEEDRVKRYIGGLMDNIQGNVIAVEPTRLQDAIRISNNLMDQKLKGYAVKNAENKRRLEVNQRDNRGPCTVRCRKCNKVGHLTRDCKVIISTTSTQRGQVVNQRVITCFKCGRQGHFRSDCPKLKDQYHGNKAGNKNGVGEARGKAYVLGGGEANPNSNVVKGTFLLNNHYAFILFDSGADRSFVSTTFSTLIDITLDTLDASYAIKLFNERIFETNTMLRGCTLGLSGHPFNIDLMPVELGSFDDIIGDGGGRREKLKLSIISCTKTQKYIEKGCQIFLEHVTKKETEGKSEEKRLEDVPTVRDFPEVFPEDLPGLPPTRQVEFQIDLVPGAAPMARAPYRLASSELQEFAPILALPEGIVNFVGYCDASHNGLGAVLMQKEKFIAYASHKLKIHEKNYTTRDLELGAVVFALKMWRHLPLRYEILDAQVEARKKENYVTKDLCCMIKKLEPRTDGTLCLNGRSWITCQGTDNQEKDEKQSQNDKTGLGMEKTVKDKAKSKPESQSSQKVNRKVNWSKSKSTQVNPEAKVTEI